MKKKRFYLADFAESVNDKPIRIIYILIIMVAIYFALFFYTNTFLFPAPLTYPEENFTLLENTMYSMLNTENRSINFSDIPDNVEWQIIPGNNGSIKIKLSIKDDVYFVAIYSVTLNPDFETIKSYRNFVSLEDYEQSAKLSAHIVSIPLMIIIFLFFILIVSISKYRKEKYLERIRPKPSILIQASKVL